MDVASYISTKASKGRASTIEGRGLFAVAPITVGEVVAVKGGHIVTRAQLAEHAAVIGNSDVRIAEDLYLAALHPEEYEAVMLFLNHSCEPNVGVRGNVVFVAMRDVAAGEELTRCTADEQFRACKSRETWCLPVTANPRGSEHFRPRGTRRLSPASTATATLSGRSATSGRSARLAEPRPDAGPRRADRHTTRGCYGMGLVAGHVVCHERRHVGQIAQVNAWAVG